MIPNIKPKSARATVSIYLRFIRKYKLLSSIVLIMLPITVITGQILLPMVYANAINLVKDHIGSGGTLGSMFSNLLWSSIILISATWVSWRIIGYSLSTLVLRVKRDLEQHIYGHLITHSYDFHVNSFSGSLVAQTNRMTSAFERLAITFYFDILLQVIKIVAMLIVITSLSKTASLLLASWMTIFSLLVVFMQIKKVPFSRDSAAADSRVTATLADSLANIFTVITFGRRYSEQKIFNNASQKRYKTALKDEYISEAIYAFQGIMIMAVEAGIIWVSVSLALAGKISLGGIVLIQFYVLNILGSMWNLGRMVRNIEKSFSDAYEMTQILYTKESVKDPTNPIEPKIKQGLVVFDSVSFCYPDGKRLFNNFDLKIKPGERVGLVGPSGGGKTTITKLLLRLMDVEAGGIYIDGMNITQMRQDDLRRAIAFVPQEPALFHRTLKDNISYGRPGSSDAKIYKASKEARAHDFIKNLPQKYETLVGERGVKLSGGQRQRVAIARAILKDSPILLLDEATSALDSVSENLIQEALAELMKNRTSIVIAHRLSTVQHMDRIVVVDEGRIIEEGSHDQLVANDGLYAKLWKHQTGGFLK